MIINKTIPTDSRGIEMSMKSFLVILLVSFGIIFSGCDNRNETSKKVTNNNSITQTQNIQQPQKASPMTDDEKMKAWKKATDTSGHDFSNYSKPLP
jgi:inner membrane protein involved in colicin E2 resistance